MFTTQESGNTLQQVLNNLKNGSQSSAEALKTVESDNFRHCEA